MLGESLTRKSDFIRPLCIGVEFCAGPVLGKQIRKGLKKAVEIGWVSPPSGLGDAADKAAAVTVHRHGDQMLFRPELIKGEAVLGGCSGERGHLK